MSRLPDPLKIEAYPVPVIAWMIQMGWVLDGWPLEFTREGRYWCTTKAGGDRAAPVMKRAVLGMKALSAARSRGGIDVEVLKRTMAS